MQLSFGDSILNRWVAKANRSMDSCLSFGFFLIARAYLLASELDLKFRWAKNVEWARSAGPKVQS